MKVTFFGTTTLLFDDGKDQILFDSHFTRPSLFKYIANSKAKTDTAICDELIRRHRINRLRAVFISHTHHDHVMDAPYIVNRCGSLLYGSESAKNVALGGGVPEERITVFKDRDEFGIGDYRVKVIRSVHSKPFILNNDLGRLIETMPAGLRDFREGGSYDFYIEHGDNKILIRPSFNYIAGQLDGIRADTLFLGVSGLSKARTAMRGRFFSETIEKTGARTVIPIHWDNFFSPLSKPAVRSPGIIDRTKVSFFRLAEYCESRGVNFVIQIPRTSIEI